MRSVTLEGTRGVCSSQRGCGEVRSPRARLSPRRDKRLYLDYKNERKLDKTLLDPCAVFTSISASNLLQRRFPENFISRSIDTCRYICTTNFFYFRLVGTVYPREFTLKSIITGFLADLLTMQDSYSIKCFEIDIAFVLYPARGKWSLEADLGAFSHATIDPADVFLNRFAPW